MTERLMRSVESALLHLDGREGAEPRMANPYCGTGEHGTMFACHSYVRDTLRAALRAELDEGTATPDPTTPPGRTSWRCFCGAWNHAACRKCGKGPDERYASGAELDALAAPSPEAKPPTPEQWGAGRERCGCTYGLANGDRGPWHLRSCSEYEPPAGAAAQPDAGCPHGINGSTPSPGYYCERCRKKLACPADRGAASHLTHAWGACAKCHPVAAPAPASPATNPKAHEE